MIFDTAATWIPLGHLQIFDMLGRSGLLYRPLLLRALEGMDFLPQKYEV